LLVNTGGKERAEPEFASLFEASRLMIIGVSRAAKPSTLSVIEASIP
jgi:hypothetical protein